MTGARPLFWFIPVLLTLHNAEEAFTMPEWIGANLPMLQERIPLFRFLHFSAPQLYISLTLVTLIPWLVTFVCLHGPLTRLRAAVLLTLQSVIFWNALMPHLSGTLLLGMYNPGTVTALAVNIPFSLYLYRVVRSQELLPYLYLRKVILAGAFLYLPLVYTNHLLAGLLSRLL
jgi:hypothetical protein